MLKRSSFVRLLVLLIFLALPISLLAGRFLQPEGVARGKSSAFPLSDQLTPEQAQAQELALADARVQGYTAGHQSEVFGVRQLLAGQHTPASEACLTADCHQVEIYNFDENAAVKAVVNLDTEEVLDVLYLVGEHPGINKRLADRAMEIAVNAPAVIDALGYRPTNASMAPVPGNMLDTSCTGEHLCVAPSFQVGDGRILWAVVDLTEDRLAGIAWTEVPAGTPSGSIPFIPEGCPSPGTLTRDGWDLAYGVTGNDGLRVYDVTYNSVEVLTSVKLLQWHADYGSTGYQDTTGCSGGGGGFPIYPYGPTVINDLYDGQNELIGFEVVQDFRMGNWGNNCNYRYEQHLQFFTDGRFRVVGGAYGKGCGPAMYRPVVRIDIAVDGDDNDNFAYYDGAGWVDMATEDFRLPYTDPQFPNNGPHQLTPENYSWRVRDAGGTGYYLEQDLGQFNEMLPGRGDAPFLYATLHKPAEGDTDLGVIGTCCNDDHEQGPHLFVNDEAIANENIVLWYVSQMQTENVPPDYYCWTVSGEPNPETYPCFGGPMFHPFDEGPGQVAQASFTHDGPKLVGEAVNFTNTTTGTPPITYSWDFGDGSTPVTEENPSHLYNQAGDFVVTLTATNEPGSTVYTDTVTIEEGVAAQAGFTYSGSLLVGQPMTFTNTTTGTAPITYSWDFGDGSDPVTEEHPAHAYEQAGDFIVTLTAGNDWGSSVYSETVTINMAATAGTILTDLEGVPATTGQEIHFSSTAAGTQPLTYAWDFGDGTTSDEVEPVHAFAAPGVYSVTLTVSNNYGSDTANLTVLVTLVKMPLTHYFPILMIQE